MKKYLFIFTLLISLAFSNSAFAVGFIPRKSTFINEYGRGVLYTSRMTVIHSEPNDESKIIEIIKWDERGSSPAYSNLKSSDIFMAFVPRLNIALMAVNDDIEGWCKVVYDQRNLRYGWVKLDKNSKFYTWRDFLNSTGRRNGMYFWRDFSEMSKFLRTAPDEKSQIVSQFNTTDDVQLQFIRGNWALVKVNETNIFKPVGWIKWRDISGKIYLFPKMVKD